MKKYEYLGYTVNFKTRKHFKDKKSNYVDESEWVIFENTQEPIIDQQTFDTVQKIRKNVRRYPNGWGEVAPLTGLLFCADCGGKMYVHRTNNGKRESQYTCSQYSKVPVGKLCQTQHRIKEAAVLQLISEMLKEIYNYANEYKERFAMIIQEALLEKYQNFDNLTIDMLNEFIEKILVHERARKGSADTTQEVEIYFNFIGRFVPPDFVQEPTPEEIEEMRKKDELKDRLHRNYLRRKGKCGKSRCEERR